jgi:hypothetical protein
MRPHGGGAAGDRHSVVDGRWPIATMLSLPVRVAWYPRLRSRDVARAGTGSAVGLARAMGVDFQRAREVINRMGEHPPSVRARTLAAYVGLFELADEHGVVNVASERIAEELELSRVSWLHYREVLEAAGLLRVAPLHGGSRRRMELRAPRKR